MLKTPRLHLIHGLYCRSVEYGALFNFDNVCISWTIVIALVVIIHGSQENYIVIIVFSSIFVGIIFRRFKENQFKGYVYVIS